MEIAFLVSILGVLLLATGLMAVTAVRSFAPTEKRNISNIRELEGRMKAIEAEWTDVYAKFRSLHGRLTKERGIEAARIAEIEAEPAPIAPSGIIPRRGSRMSLLGRTGG